MRHPAIRWVIGALTVLALLAAMALVVTSRQWSTDASAARRDTAEVRDERARADVAARRASADADVIAEAAEKVRAAFVATGTAIDAAVDAHNHAVDVHNAGADLFNQGQLTASQATFTNDGEPAVAEVGAKVTAAQQALAALQAAIHELEEHVR